MSQMRGQDKTPEKQLDEVKTGNLPEKDRSRSQKRTEAKIEKMQEMLTKDSEELKNKQR